MAFLDYNLARMGNIDRSMGRMSEQAFAAEQAAKGRLFGGVQNLAGTLNQRAEAKKLAEAKALEAERGRTFESGAARDLAAAREKEIAEGYGLGHKQALELQRLRNVGAGPQAKDYDLYEISQRASNDIAAKLNDVWNEQGEFIGWQNVDKDAVKGMFLDAIKMSHVSEADEKLAMNYFERFLDDIANGTITQEQANEGIITILDPNTYTDPSGSEKYGLGSYQYPTSDPTLGLTERDPSGTDLGEALPTQEALGSAYAEQDRGSSVQGIINQITDLGGITPSEDTNSNKFSSVMDLLQRLTVGTDIGNLDRISIDNHLDDIKDGKISDSELDLFINLLKSVVPSTTGTNVFGGL